MQKGWGINKLPPLPRHGRKGVVGVGGWAQAVQLYTITSKVTHKLGSGMSTGSSGISSSPQKSGTGQCSGKVEKGIGAWQVCQHLKNKAGR